MYFPYLRGKQFELLALREISELPMNGNYLAPVIEPLKSDTRSIKAMVKVMPRNVRIQLIVNPEYGEIRWGNSIIAELVMEFRAAGLEHIVPAFIIGADRDVTLAQNFIRDYEFADYTLVHLNQVSTMEAVGALGSNPGCRYNIIFVNHIMALRRSFPKSTLAYLSDPFNKQQKNAHYEESNDENFSNDYLYYHDEGFVGFGDYLTIGAPYVEGGRLPWAVVIHLTYYDALSDNVRIRHFVSDSNDDDSDTAGKFAEALDKLIGFINEKGINTIAANAFRELYERGAFPGLGTIKKLSIMHHLELMQSLLAEDELL